MTERATSYHRALKQLALILALMTLVAGCELPTRGPHYVSANSTVDPFAAVRAKADQFYKAGVEDERNGDWLKALNDYRQASMWDHDEREDIANALSRAQAQVSWDAYRQTQSAPITQAGAPAATQPTATEEPAAPATTAPAPTTPTPAALAEGTKNFTSDSFPYSISIPNSWAMKPGGTDKLPADTFIASSDSDSGALVLITVEQVGSSITLDQLYLGTERALNGEGINSIQIYARRKVGDQPAYVMSYLDDTDSGKVSVRHAIFVTPGMAWHVILLATPSVTAALDQTFTAMLDSFKFEASAFPLQ